MKHRPKSTSPCRSTLDNFHEEAMYLRGATVRASSLSLLVLLVLLPLPVHAAPPNTAALNLSMKDLGKGWATQVNTTRGSSAEAQADGRPVAQVVASGFRQSNEVRYKRTATGTKRTVQGLILVDAAVQQFDTPAHAKAAYLQGMADVATNKSLHPLKVGAVGLLRIAPLFRRCCRSRV